MYSPCGNYIMLENSIFKKSINGKFELKENLYIEDSIKIDIDNLLKSDFVEKIYNKFPSNGSCSVQIGRCAVGFNLDINIYKKGCNIIDNIVKNTYNHSVLLHNYNELQNNKIIDSIEFIRKEHKRFKEEYDNMYKYYSQTT